MHQRKTVQDRFDEHFFNGLLRYRHLKHQPTTAASATVAQTFLNSQGEARRMSTIIFTLVAVIAVIAVLAVLKSKSQGGGADEVWPFYAKKPLSQPEQVLYFRLVKALPEHIILAQVQLSRLLGVKKGNNYQAWLNRINRMSADFVVCN
ncbi:MAG: DUF2726 domain-containing protein, partial [Azovibrio sp.]|nr:DUF2726 domain-containing protein [Azovibrio sp.]